MPAMTNILLRSDAAAVDHTLIPVRDIPFPSWRTNEDGVPVTGQKRLDLQFETLKNGKTKVNFKVGLPIMEVIPAGTVGASGVQAAPQVADEDSFSGTFFLSPRGTQTTRAELMRVVAHLMMGATSVTGTGVNAATAAVGAVKSSTSPLHYAVVNLLFPGS